MFVDSNLETYSDLGMHLNIVAALPAEKYIPVSLTRLFLSALPRKIC